MSRVARILTVLALALAVVVALAPASQAGQKAEVRWFQWKTTEVGEKLMNELKAAFEKETPDITLTLVDSPFTGFHDKAITLFQAQKLADVLRRADRLAVDVEAPAAGASTMGLLTGNEEAADDDSDAALGGAGARDPETDGGGVKGFVSVGVFTSFFST